MCGNTKAKGKILEECTCGISVTLAGASVPIPKKVQFCAQASGIRNKIRVELSLMSLRISCWSSKITGSLQR